jgi:iron complex transport system substrate-binding protein
MRPSKPVIHRKPHMRFILALLALACLTQPAFGQFYDDAGNTVNLTKPAPRIVSLSPAITENLFAIGAGDYVIGTSTYSDYPVAAKSIPIVADHQSVDLEKIATLKPDVIIVWQGGSSSAQIAALTRLGIPLYTHSAKQLSDIPLALMRLASLTGTERQAAAVVLSAYQDIQLLADAPSPALPTFYQVWHSPLMTLNRHSWVSDTLTRCGAHNIFSELNVTAPTVGMEDVLQRQPAILYTATPLGQADESLTMWRKWDSLPAVRANNFLYTDSDAMNRATLRTLTAAKKMCADIAQARARL